MKMKIMKFTPEMVKNLNYTLKIPQKLINSIKGDEEKMSLLY